MKWIRHNYVKPPWIRNTRRLVQLTYDLEEDQGAATLELMDMLLAKNGQKIAKIGCKLMAIKWI